MKRVLVALMLLLVSGGAAMGQMSGGSPEGAPQGMMGGAMKGSGMMPPMISGGMMGQGMGMGQPGTMPCMMMGQGQGMAGAGMKPCMMMGQAPDGMMPAHARGCFTMAGGMMAGGLDMPQMQRMLDLTPAQVEKLKTSLRPFQKEAIQLGAALRVASLDLADLLAADKVDLGKAEGALKEIGSLRTKMSLVQVRAAEEVKKIVSREQLEKFQGMCQGCSPARQPAPPPMTHTP
jgi:hypothetical protein